MNAFRSLCVCAEQERLNCIKYEIENFVTLLVRGERERERAKVREKRKKESSTDRMKGDVHQDANRT